MGVTVTAQTVDALRNQILTSLYGRRDGLDVNQYNLGPKDFRVQIESINTTAASSLSNFGISCLSCTVASSAVYTLVANPGQGSNVGVGIQGKQIIQTSTSTLGYLVQAAAGVTFLTTAGSSFNQMTFSAQGAMQELIAISSATWATKNTANTGVTFSTF